MNNQTPKLSPLLLLPWIVSGVLISLSPLPCPTWAQPAISTAQVTAIVGRDVLIAGQVARVNDTAQTGQQIRTTQARSQLLLNTGSMTRLGPGSAYTLRADCIEVTAGKLLIHGSSQVCHSNGILTAQDTTYLLQVFSSGIAQLSVLTGSLTLSNPQNTAIPPLTILPGHVVTIDREGREQSRRDLSAPQYGVLLADELMTLFGDLPDMRRFRSTFVRLYPGDPVPSPIQIPADRGAGPISRVRRFRESLFFAHP